MNIRDSVRSILSDKKARQQGLHVKHIARHILNMNSNLFNHDENPGYEALKAKVNRMLLYEVKKKKGLFTRVINPKTNKYRKGWYRLKKQ
jgi:hypothetical protein